MTFTDLLKNKTRFLALWKISEYERNSLRIIISIQKSGTEELTKLCGTEFMSSPVIDDENEPLIVIDFPRYINCSIQDEVFCSADKAEEFEGNRFRIYTKSKFMEYVGVETDWRNMEKTVRHYCICCCRHVIDVVSSYEPQVYTIERPNKLE